MREGKELDVALDTSLFILLMREFIHRTRTIKAMA